MAKAPNGEDKLWLKEARLGRGFSERLVRVLGKELRPHVIERKFAAGLLVDQAHVIMLTERQIIPEEKGAAILRVLREIEAKGLPGFPLDPELLDDYLNIENYITRKLGVEIGGAFQTGRSRNDRTQTIRRLITREGLIRVVRDLIGSQDVVLRVASEHVETIMPGYTHLQPAQPITLAHYLICTFDQLHRDFQRLSEAYRRVNLNPLGAAALAGTSWPLDRLRTAELLGFEGLVRNSKDAVMLPEYELEALSVLGMLMTHISLFANDLYLWQTSEFGMVELADEYCDTSSMMPQKKNPRGLEVVKAKAGYVVGLPSVMFSSMRMVSSTDFDVLLAPHIIQSAFDATEDSLSLLEGFLPSMKVNRQVMKESVDKSWSTVVGLADYIVRYCGLTFREAHQICGRLVRICLQRDIEPTKVTSSLLAEASRETLGRPVALRDDEIKSCLDAAEFIRANVTSGSVNPHEVQRMLQESRSMLDQERIWLQEMQSRIEGSLKMLRGIGAP